MSESEQRLLDAMANTNDKAAILDLANTYKALRMINSNIESDINDKLLLERERGEEDNGTRGSQDS